MKINTLIQALFCIAIIASCGPRDNVDPKNGTHSEWLIPSNEVFDGGPGKDGIPSVDQPNFSSISDIDFVNNDDLVVGFIADGVAKAYPHPILDWHEIVNDDIGSQNVAITYCPLTGTAIGWDRNVNGGVTTFGVSGKLYNTNLMPYDRATDSYWSQIGLNCVNGELISAKILTKSVIETTWETWKKLYPNSEVLNTSTGFNRSYGQYPYNDYRTNHDNIIFPVTPMDNRLPAKERVLGVIDGKGGKAYRFGRFIQPAVYLDVVNNEEIIVVGSQSLNFIVAFKNTYNLENLEVNLDHLPIILQDDAGNKISIDGSILEGPQSGKRLGQTNSFIGYWFSFGAFYPEIEIF